MSRKEEYILDFYIFYSGKPHSAIWPESETFEKRSILFKVKEDENFNHRNTLSISRIKI
jgi:hypothetical protein